VCVRVRECVCVRIIQSFGVCETIDAIDGINGNLWDVFVCVCAYVRVCLCACVCTYVCVYECCVCISYHHFVFF